MPAPRLLLVDDEIALAGLLKKYLERLGYEVEAVHAAEPALELFDANPMRYDLVLADLTLPEMNGEELLGRMLERQATLGAILVSGYPHRPQIERIWFLQKPFLPKMLAGLIVKVLAKRGESAQFT